MTHETQAMESLALSPEEVRRLGHRVVDAYVDHLVELRDRSPSPVASMRAFRALVDEPPPRAPTDLDAVLDLALLAVRDHINHTDHPRNFARVPSASNPAGVLGDMLATAFNAGAMSATGHPGPTALEILVLEWIVELLGLPARTEGILLSGGSVSSLSAFAAARQAVLGGPDPLAVAYLTVQTHTSMARGLRILGVPDAQIRKLPVDEGFRMELGALEAAIERDRADGLRPFLVVATAGTTNTGAVDPLPAIADLAATEGLWLHIDGAYGAPAALTPQGRALLAGIDRADSITLDPHKWLFNPYELGVLLVTRPGALEAMFAVAPEYLRDIGDDVNFRDRGPQLTRATRALKLWMTFKTFGTDAVCAAVARGIALAELAERTLRATPGWEIVTPAQLGVVTFAHERADAAELTARAVAAGFCVPSSTVLHGRSVMRLCTINPRTTDDEVVATIEHLTQLAREEHDNDGEMGHA